MLRLKSIPQFARLFSVPPKASSLQCRCLATSSRRRCASGGRDGEGRGSRNSLDDDSEYEAEYNVKKPIAQRASKRDAGPRGFEGPGRTYSVDGPGPGRQDDEDETAGDAKLIAALKQELAQMDGSDEDEEEEHKHLKHKDKAYLRKNFDDDETLSRDDLHHRRRDRQGAVIAKGRAALDKSEDEDADAEDEQDEEWKAISNMDNEAFEKHLRQRQNPRPLEEDRYNAGTDALEGKISYKGQAVQEKRSSPVTPLEKDRWEPHNENVQQRNLKKLAEGYNFSKARVHASLWLREMQKQGVEVNSTEQENKEYINIETGGDTSFPRHSGNDQWVTPWTNIKFMPDDWEGSVRTEEAIQEVSVKEEEMMLEEFERRMEHNRLQIASFVKQHIYSQRRPVEGWNYIVENFGPESRRRKGAQRFAGASVGKQTKLDDLEKLTLKH